MAAWMRACGTGSHDRPAKTMATAAAGNDTMIGHFTPAVNELAIFCTPTLMARLSSSKPLFAR